LKIVHGNFGAGKESSKTLNEKVTEGLDKLQPDKEKNYPFILIVDTGEDLKVVSDVDVEKLNMFLDLVKQTVLMGAYE
jgi:hypothetical protein